MQAFDGKLVGGRYRVINRLGGGGGGETYTAADMHRPGHPKCVVKRLKPATNDPSLLPIARNLFNREAETLEHLGHHNQIPRLLAYFEEDAEFYLVQDFIEGHPLNVELPAGHCWSETKVIQLLQDVLTTLEFVHSQGVIHRDVKPANLIRRNQDNKLVLIDFGAVKQVRGNTQTTTHSRIINPTTISIGTEGYMPPEQWMGKPYLSSDIYALGMIGIQALTGTEQTRLAQLPRDAGLEVVWQPKTQVHDELVAILSKMVRYHFMQRYQSATEALEALQGCIEVMKFSSEEQVHPQINETDNSQSTWVIQLSEPTSKQQVEPTETKVSAANGATPQQPVAESQWVADSSPILESGELGLETETNPEDTTSNIETTSLPASLPELVPKSKAEIQATKVSLITESPLPETSAEVQLAETKVAHPTEPRIQPANVDEPPVTRVSTEAVKAELTETKFSQPERLQPPVELPETKFSQLESQSGSELPETKYSQLERSHSEILETKYSQPERVHSSNLAANLTTNVPENIVETKFSPDSTPVAPSRGVQSPSRFRQKRWLAVGLGTGAAVLAIVAALLVIKPGSEVGLDSPPDNPPETPLPETPLPETPLPDLKGDYTQLQKYLEAGKLEEADRETYEVMLKVAGEISEKQGYFAMNEWQKFPCEDFREIDRLWSKTSGGKLGFSAQTRILNQVSDPTKSPEENGFKYLNEIGWQKGQKRVVALEKPTGSNRFVYKTKPTFENPPPGHLPAKLIWSNQKDERFAMVRKCEL